MDSSVFISAHVPQLLAEADPFSCHLARTSSVPIRIKSSQRRTLWSDALLLFSWCRVGRWQRENDIFTLCPWSTWLCSEGTDFESNSHSNNNHYIQIDYPNHFVSETTRSLKLVWECPELFQGFNWQPGAWKPTPGRMIRVHANDSTQCVDVDRLLAHPSLHRVSSQGPTDPSDPPCWTLNSRNIGKSLENF